MGVLTTGYWYSGVGVVGYCKTLYDVGCVELNILVVDVIQRSIMYIVLYNDNDVIVL